MADSAAMPSTRPERRPRRRPAATLAVLGLALGLGLAACTGSTAPTPTIPSVDFTPHLVIGIDDAGTLHVVPATGTDASSVPQGTVALVRNDGTTDHRVTGTIDGKVGLDTGTQHPGDTTTVVLGDAGTLELQVDQAGQTTTITVEAR